VATTSRTTPKPKTTRADFDIALVEREVRDGETVRPFTVQLTTGKRAVLKNPQLIGWQKASALTPEEPLFFLRTVVDEEDWDEFIAEDFSVGTMRRLVEAWREHYNMPSLGE